MPVSRSSSVIWLLREAEEDEEEESEAEVHSVAAASAWLGGGGHGQLGFAMIAVSFKCRCQILRRVNKGREMCMERGCVCVSVFACVCV